MIIEGDNLIAWGEQLERQNERLRAALEPFARHANAPSLSKALGHIEREHLLEARKALDR